MKIPTELLRRVLLDVRLQPLDTIERDYREICSRYEKEGMSFLTISLPRLDEALLAGLSRGHLTRMDFQGFRPRSRGGSLPALLSGFFRRVFHDDGSVIGVPDIGAIFAIRQVTRLFKKVELPCSSPRVKAAYERYVSNDREVDWRRHRSPYDAGLWASICGYLWSDLEELSGELYCFPGVFGSGATAERKSRNKRHSVSEWPERSEGCFPASFHATAREDSAKLESIKFLSLEEERPARVVQVPKTLKTPRTISVEPSYMMLMQQSIAKPLMVYLESKRFGFKSIRFTDQSVNNELARIGSLDGGLATIDLKDASDMVDLDLVRNIFRGPCPSFLELIENCRTTKALLPDGSQLPLRKFASMGSALCFPIEAMVFFTIIMYALVEKSGKLPSRRFLLELAKNVAVYGDDIIVPTSMAPVVMERLEDFGLIVNRDKSFLTGLFRESCGGDYYNGVNITPTYVRQWDDTGTLSNSSHKVAYVSLSNTLYAKGLWNASQYLREELELLLGSLPLSRTPIGVLHFASFLRDSNLSYWRSRSGYRVRGSSVRSRTQDDSPEDADGFLHLAFQNRTQSDAIKEFKVLCQSSQVHGHRIPSRGDRGGVVLPFQPEHPASGISSGRGLLPGLEGLPSEEREEHDYASLAQRGYSYNPGVGGFEHLKVVQSSSLYTSDRPHALCLKRGWTASQAGLKW